MKNSAKQTLLTIICIIIVFIPTYIAVAFYVSDNYSDMASKYSVTIRDDQGNDISLFNQDIDDIAKSILKMNSKLIHTVGIDPNNLPQKYYDIKVSVSGTTSFYRYYFSTNEDKKTIVKDSTGNYYTLEFKNVKNFLSKSCCYYFYENSALPKLSVSGGDDILPSQAEWKYRTVSNSLVYSPNFETADGMNSYAMTGKSKLSFSVQPDECKVKIYLKGDEIYESHNLEDIPYDRLDHERLTFEISAKWSKSNDYRGYAEYNFTSSIGKAPEFFIKNKAIYAGEFFIVSGLNISSPQKIEFSSNPSIDCNPIFFNEGETVCALIPVSNEFVSPRNYTFTFKYGNFESEIQVSVMNREIKEREYDTRNINTSRTKENINNYNKLIDEIGSKHENIKYFNDTFLDYTKYFSDDRAKVYLGFGHKRIPSNGEDPFFLDGVDYIMPEDENVLAVCAGKVVYSGNDALLGKFVVIDHGFGLKTWYCHLSEITVTVGITVSKGQSIGKPGNTGYTNSIGVYLITTIQNVPVSPYPLQENLIKFKK